ncbi:hypothetical protein FOA52_014274 [Chlamydomonas sp. UWO 241]|nr:hypothetical protein FOA52_014274 [Chlamydomonas sp. UWO 241]
MLRMPVALKCMRTREGDVALQAFKRELVLGSCASLGSHESIARMLDAFVDGLMLVVVWELVQGPDLLDLLNEAHGVMPERAACFYFRQLLCAVDALHECGFCHRDIKPENCMVSRSSHRLKLIDFGLSKHLGSARTLGVGTADYMAPENSARQT